MSSLRSFLHLIKRSDALKLGADYLTLSNVHRISVILYSPLLSPESKQRVENFAMNNKIAHYPIDPSILVSLFPGKEVKVISVTNVQSGKKIKQIMKEGTAHE